MSSQIFSPTSGAVLVAPTAEALFGLWYATTARTNALGCGVHFANFAEVEAASAHGAAALGAAIEVRLPGAHTRVATTVGRVLLARVLPVRIGFEIVNRSINAAAAALIIEEARRQGGLDGAAAVARELWSFGARAATESGLSLSMDDLRSPAESEAILAEGQAACARIAKLWDDGEITDAERYNVLTDALIATEARIRDAVIAELAQRPPLGALAASGALSGIEGLGQCVGVVGVTRNPGGDLAEIGVFHGFAEGLSAHETFRVASEARADAVRLLDKEREAHVLGEQLAAGLAPVRITTLDCGSRSGITLGSLVDDHRVLVELGTRLLGRALVEAVLLQDGSTILAEAGAIIDEATAARIDRELVPTARIRSPLTCAAAMGVCASCYGWIPGNRAPAALGARIGLTAARAVASLVPRLVGRTISLNSNGYQSAYDADATTASGVVRHERLDLARPRDSDAPVMMGDRGRITILDEHGEDIESFLVFRGDQVQIEDGCRAPSRQRVVARSRARHALLLADVPLGAEAAVSFDEQELDADRTLSLHRNGWGRRVLARAGTTLRLDALLEDGSREVTQVQLAAGAHVLVAQGEAVRRGEILAESTCRTVVWFRDIWGGLPRFLAILRADEPGEPAILAEVDGTLEVIEISEKGRRIRIDPDDGGSVRHHWLPGSRGDWWPEDGPVARGATRARHGSRASPRDLLRIFGVDWMAEHLHAELCDIVAYSKQPIAGAHLELVVREMLRYARVEAGVRRPALFGVQQLAHARQTDHDS